MNDITLLRRPGGATSEHAFARVLENDDLLRLLQGLRRSGRAATREVALRPLRAFGGQPRIAVIANQRSHRNQAAGHAPHRARGTLYAAPDGRDQMVAALASFAREGVDLLVIDGGDGTVRDVLSAAGPLFGDALPPIGLIPSGKTNALATDLGIAVGRDVASVVAAFRAGSVVARSPIEIVYDRSDVALKGFLLGGGAFVRATMLAQHTHRLGAFDGLAVGLSVAGAIFQTCVGSKTNSWRAGETVRFTDATSGRSDERRLYMLLMSTLRKFPLGVRPLGKAGPGLDMLMVDAPPRLLPIAAPAIVVGREGGWLERMGYRHAHDVRPTRLDLESGFVLDGETFPGGAVTVRAGDPVRFVVP